MAISIGTWQKQEERKLMKKNKTKPKFGIMIAITESPVGAAYKKAEKKMKGKKK